MQTRTIPSSGQALPVVGCGTWLGFDVGRDASAIAQRGKVLDALFKAGGQVVDSSPMYGSAEEVVGTLLSSGGARDKAFVATKVWTSGRRAGIEQMERSMRRLKRDRIDLVQVHNLLDWQVHLSTLREWKDRERVSYIGVTHYNEGGYAELEMVMKAEPLDFVQFNYSAADRKAEERLLPLATEHNKTVLIN